MRKVTSGMCNLNAARMLSAAMDMLLVNDPNILGHFTTITKEPVNRG
jgi:hypothetical protein